MSKLWSSLFEALIANFAVIGMVLTIVFLLIFTPYCGEENDEFTVLNEGSYVPCESTAECQESLVCSQGACVQKPEPLPPLGD